MKLNSNVYSFRTNDIASFEKARHIREKVFIVEQNVDRDEEFDDYEDESIHYLLEVDGEPVGTARWRHIGDQVKLERFAVYLSHRNQGYGLNLLNQVMKDALETGKDLFMHAQVKALSFYERRGFKKVGEQFLECDIEHFKMVFKNK
ncbi:MAG: GNAT family N-acetyltransferase [Bacteroidetes bacterium]|nr:MAG: GNAT family N-acetyltransferase [Bacteroidota bacterium]MBL1145285.1 GNAT family N-acetyltransferase [Bacteroidota bacterium]MCB0803397.1 GNAT family N-acetyltransferase [Flavobacteriales bacterium]NOG58082.1 GNAT family N-acetyltransferase [Bacteroidota bacterium]